MALHLKDLIAKAESKGIKAKEDPPILAGFLKPWQEESILFNKTNEALTLDEKNIQKKDITIKKRKFSQNKEKNRQQTDNKPITNRQQTNNKVATNRQQENILKTKYKQSGNKVEAQPATQLITKWQQTDNKAATNDKFSSIIGLQRAIIIFIYSECKIARSKTTGNLTLEHLSMALNSPTGSIKSTIQRLEKKKLLQRVEYKNGRGGWSRYAIPDSLYQELLQYETGNKLAINWQQTGNKVEAQPATEPATRLSSSSIYNNKTTTIELPKEWIEIDISSLEDIGFSQNHLIQLFKIETFTTQSVEDSIEYFAFDLKNNNKLREIKTNPLSYFMGILKRSGVYTAPENYESPRDRAMRLYLAKQKEIKQKRETMENELFDLAFSDWEVKLGEEERSHIIPEEVKKMKFRGASLSALKEYFRESMWPEERMKIGVKNLKEN